MLTHVFDKCSPLTSHPGLSNFQFCMFHGHLLDARTTATSCEVVRNTFFEPAVALPRYIILLKDDLAARVKPFVDAEYLEVIDAYTFHLPWHLTEIPPDLGRAAPRIEREMEAMNERMLPRARSSARYVAMCPRRVAAVAPAGRAEVTRRAPYSDETETWEVVRDAGLLESLGVVTTGFGYQVCDRVLAMLRLHLPRPYFRVRTFRI